MTEVLSLDDFGGCGGILLDSHMPKRVSLIPALLRQARSHTFRFDPGRSFFGGSPKDPGMKPVRDAVVGCTISLRMDGLQRCTSFLTDPLLTIGSSLDGAIVSRYN